MPKVNIDISKKKKERGRPRKPDALTTLVPVQLSAGIAAALDAWAEANSIPSRSGAARALIEEGLERAAKRRHK